MGLIAFPSSAAAVPPVVPTCAFPNTPASDSCAKLLATGSPNPIGAAYENLRMGIRVRSQLESGSETQSVILRFDDDIKVNLATVPGTCTAAQLSGDTIAQAYAQCGPGTGGSNTYLSPAGNVSGVGSTVVAGIDACTMAFKGANNNQIILYARSPIGGPPTECNNPATNNTGSTTTVFVGHPDEPARGLAVRQAAHGARHQQPARRPGRLLRDHLPRNGASRLGARLGKTP